MSGKLDRSLDDILKTSRSARNRTRRSTRNAKAGGAAAAPIGGVKKTTKAAKPAVKGAAPTKPAGSGEGKIIISGLPQDVDEKLLKDYFTGLNLPGVKKVLLTYGPEGRSRGIATAIFHKRETAQQATQKLHNHLIDGRPIKVELVVSAAEAPIIPAKSLGDRITKSQPAKNAKAQPKPATGPKSAVAAKKGKGKNEKAARPRKTKKTAEELDAEMADYFVGNEAGSGGAVQPAANGDVGMDEIN